MAVIELASCSRLMGFGLRPCCVYSCMSFLGPSQKEYEAQGWGVGLIGLGQRRQTQEPKPHSNPQPHPNRQTPKHLGPVLKPYKNPPFSNPYRKPVLVIEAPIRPRCLVELLWHPHSTLIEARVVILKSLEPFTPRIPSWYPDTTPCHFPDRTPKQP